MYSSIVRVEETESLHWIGAGVECTKALRCWACMMGKYGSIPTRSCFVLLSTLSLGWRMARPRPSLLLICLPYVAINLACSIQSHRLHHGLWALFRALCARHSGLGTFLVLLEAFSSLFRTRSSKITFGLQDARQRFQLYTPLEGLP